MAATADGLHLQYTRPKPKVCTRGTRTPDTPRCFRRWVCIAEWGAGMGIYTHTLTSVEVSRYVALCVHLHVLYAS